MLSILLKCLPLIPERYGDTNDDVDGLLLFKFCQRLYLSKEAGSRPQARSRDPC